MSHDKHVQSIPVETATEDGPSTIPRPASFRETNGKPSAIENELRHWETLSRPEQQDCLRSVVETGSGFSYETLVRICSDALRASDVRLLNLAFEALAKKATPLLLRLAPSQSSEQDREDHAQEILTQVFEDILSGNTGFSARNFVVFARRRSIDLYRRRKRRLEAHLVRIEPTEDDLDPLDQLIAPSLDPQNEAALRETLGKLPERLRQPFIQHECLGMTQREIAEHHGVTDRTVRNWLAEASRKLQEL